MGYSEHTSLNGDGINERCQKHLAEASVIKSQLTNDSLKPIFALNRYNDILIHINAAMGEASLLSQVHPDERVRSVAQKCEQEVSRFITDLSLDRNVYDVLKRGENESFSNLDKRMLEKTLREFRRAGVDKDESTREKIRTLRDELVTLGQQFGQNIRDDRFTIKVAPKDLDGLPKDYIDAHKPGPDGQIEISTDAPDYVPFMQYAVNDELRKALRFKYNNRGQKNESVLRLMIEKRNELAKLLNYPSYADYVVEDKMIKERKAVEEFIDKISDMAKKGADSEFQKLLSFKKKYNKNATTIYGHEAAFLEENFKKSELNFDSQAVRPYFAYDKVKQGLLAVTSQLFRISYRPVSDAHVWHPSVDTYDVYNEQGEKLGRIYLDMHPREGKFKHAAQFPVVNGVKDRTYPEGALVCNFPNPKDGPALMEHGQITTMFHEFGHLLHHIFAGKQAWLPFSGVATEWDFVEAPSQLLEEWAWAKEVLHVFALHYQTNEVIPEELIMKLRAADEFGKAIKARQQMFYAALSVNYFGKDPKSLDLLSELKSLQARYSYYPYEEGTHFYRSFGHLDDYSAIYYTYMWSLSLAKDLFEPFKNQMMDPSVAARYKELVLVPGGSKDAADLVKDFLGRPFKFDAFARWLTEDKLQAKSK